MSRIDQALRKARGEQPAVPEESGSGAEPLFAEGHGRPALEEAPRERRPAATHRQLERIQTGGLSTFTRVVQSQTLPRNGYVERLRLISALEPNDPTLDQFRTLAATLHQAQMERQLGVLTVTSAASGEGKTLTAANLALTLAHSFHRQVLLIDADLRRPGMYRLFPVPVDDGVRGALEAIRQGTPIPIHEVAPRLALLPAGKPTRDPVSIFSADAMFRMIAAAASSFDWVILDAPPVGMLPDASLISSLGDAVLLVVQAGRVRYDLVQRSVEALGADRIFGVVLNRVPENDLVSSYGAEYYSPYR
jgi:capsular exopolysaccharide synthesis family protein